LVTFYVRAVLGAASESFAGPQKHSLPCEDAGCRLHDVKLSRLFSATEMQGYAP